VEAKKYERALGSFINLVHYVQIQGIRNSSNIVYTSRDENKWIEICSKIQFNPRLIGLHNKKLFDLLQEYQDVFTWHKGELSTCGLGKHTIDTHGFPPCRMTLGRLSFWEEVEVDMHIQTFVKLGKMQKTSLNMHVRLYFL
jgi:hypothetical protein